MSLKIDFAVFYNELKYIWILISYINNNNKIKNMNIETEIIIWFIFSGVKNGGFGVGVKYFVGTSV